MCDGWIIHCNTVFIMAHVGLRKPRRTKIQLEEDLLNALERLVTKMGFASIPLYMITQEADIDSNVFYRRYNNINELFALLAQRYAICFDELISLEELDSLGERKFLITLLESLFSHISDSKVAQRLLAWELSESNEVTRNSAISREKSAQFLINHYTTISRGKGVDMRSAIEILIAAIYYITIYRSTLNLNTTISFKGTSGDKEIMGTIEMIVNMLFDKLERVERLRRCIKMMLKDGLSPESIQRYLELSSAEYEFILA